MSMCQMWKDSDRHEERKRNGAQESTVEEYLKKLQTYICLLLPTDWPTCLAERVTW